MPLLKFAAALAMVYLFAVGFLSLGGCASRTLAPPVAASVVQEP